MENIKKKINYFQKTTKQSHNLSDIIDVETKMSRKAADFPSICCFKPFPTTRMWADIKQIQGGILL